MLLAGQLCTRANNCKIGRVCSMLALRGSNTRLLRRASSCISSAKCIASAAMEDVSSRLTTGGLGIITLQREKALNALTVGRLFIFSVLMTCKHPQPAPELCSSQQSYILGVQVGNITFQMGSTVMPTCTLVAGMSQHIQSAMDSWGSRSTCSAIMIHSSTPRALCAGVVDLVSNSIEPVNKLHLLCTLDHAHGC